MLYNHEESNKQALNDITTGIYSTFSACCGFITVKNETFKLLNWNICRSEKQVLEMTPEYSFPELQLFFFIFFIFTTLKN